MEAITCIKERRSVRSFQDKAVDHALLEQVVDAARFAPSWKNTQPARYVVVEGAKKDELAKAATDAYPHNGEIICQAPALVVVTYVSGRSGFERDGSFSTDWEDRWEVFDTGIATEAFCLAAHEAGLGTVIMGIFDNKIAAEMIGLEEGRKVACLIPIGYPAESPAAPRRKEVGDLISFIS
ncbi:MAG: nitroreductase family protein [Lachnospiraceae bacterium]|nr:nitroreductase family protein [Lachnospiraceae bacterium]